MKRAYPFRFRHDRTPWVEVEKNQWTHHCRKCQSDSFHLAWRDGGSVVDILPKLIIEHHGSGKYGMSQTGAIKRL